MSYDVSFDAYRHLVELSYSAALDIDRFRDLLDAMSDELSGTYMCLHGHDHIINRNLGIVYSMYSDDAMDEFHKYYHDINPWIPGIASSPLGIATPAEVYCPRNRLLQSEFYNDWIRPQENVGTGGGLVIFRDDTRMLAISGNQRIMDQEKLQDKLLQLLNLLSPHLRQAFEIQRALHGAQLINRRYRETLDEIEYPVFLLGQDGRICHLNKAADRSLNSSDVYQVESGSRFRFYDQAANDALMTSLKSIKLGYLQNLRNPIVPRMRRKKGRQLVALVAPFRPGKESTGILSDFINVDAPTAFVTVSTRSKSQRSLSSLLTELHRLTPAEASVAEAVHTGLTLKQFAEMNDLSIHTVRNQLQSIFTKTGTRRQAELVGLVARILAN